jgi:transposase
MYVAVTGSGKARVIQFREDTRIPGTTKKKTKVVKTLGNYERMLAEDPDILQKLKREAAAITQAKKESRMPITLQLQSSEISSPDDTTPSFSFGHALIKHLWAQMALDEFFSTSCGKRNAEAVVRALYFLAAHRCAAPASIRASALGQESYAGVEPVGQDVFYDVLDVLANQKEAMIGHLCSFFARKTARHGPEAFYDVTTYHFESTKWGELRMFGFSKNHKNHEVQVVMGLLLDNNGIPITYELFAGNTMDQSTLKSAVENLKELYKLDKITVVADKGLNSGNNLTYLCGQGHDFVISYTLKRSPEAFRELVWNDEGWETIVDKGSGEVISRHKVVRQQLESKVPLATEAPPKVKKRGRPPKYRTEQIPVNIHLVWSSKRAAKDRADRERMLERLEKRLEKPAQLKASLQRGCNQYLQMQLDTEGWQIDEEKIRYAAQFDGYYAIITNNLNYTTEQVTAIYGGLWKIEESFRVLKTDLKARPVYVWNDNRIKGHFALCFLSLCLVRYAQYLLSKAKATDYSAARLCKAFREPLALAQGNFPNIVVTPTKVPQEYLDLADVLELPPLKTNMTLTQFRASTKLDLSVNLR